MVDWKEREEYLDTLYEDYNANKEEIKRVYHLIANHKQYRKTHEPKHEHGLNRQLFGERTITQLTNEERKEYFKLKQREHRQKVRTIKS